MTSNHDLKCPMLINEMTRWFFTESRLRESNPFHRFETEVLDALDHVDAEIDSDERRRLRTLVLERSDQIFESDLSWGQNIYSRENLRWVSFIAGYTLVVRESLEEAQRGAVSCRPFRVPAVALLLAEPRRGPLRCCFVLQ